VADQRSTRRPGGAGVAELPFAVESPPQLWDLKVLLLSVLFIYAFFKLSWAFRHCNDCLILVGSAPAPERVTDASRPIAARVATSTGRHFNGGLRAYYFRLAALGWFVHPWLFVVLTAWVVWIIYRREFRSRLLKTLAPPEEAGQPCDPAGARGGPD
jgi:uncharacterized membrane protein